MSARIQCAKLVVPFLANKKSKDHFDCLVKHSYLPHLCKACEIDETLFINLQFKTSCPNKYPTLHPGAKYNENYLENTSGKSNFLGYQIVEYSFEQETLQRKMFNDGIDT